MTNTSISAPSAGERVAKELAEQIEVRGENRCAICFWPLAKSVDEGCVRGNCSFRGGDEHEQKARWVIRERIKANTALLATALAACAREAKLEEAKLWHAQMEHYHGWTRESWGRERLAALERAAGERAGDLRVKS